jgi:hypothetical protein
VRILKPPPVYVEAPAKSKKAGSIGREDLIRVDLEFLGDNIFLDF